GFRFDLASILSRDREGHILPNPPVVEAIAEDPLLADTKIIAEAWDAAGAYQVGSFANLRWAEWNGRYRDDLRCFWRGDPHHTPALATRLAGSSDLYQPGGRQPYHSINFITSHDGFPLNDLVTYNEKHNELNGEEGRDGDNNNCSYNYGVEGPTRRKSIEKIRLRQLKNMAASLLLSQGVPMILAGDECRRTQRGNNNAYCQDNAISWFNWRLVEKNAELRRFFEVLIAFRKAESTVRQLHFLSGEPVYPGGLPDISWYTATGESADWSGNGGSLTCLLGAQPQPDPLKPSNHHVLIMMHAGSEPRRFSIPKIARPLAWRLFINTAAESPADAYPQLNGPSATVGKGVELESRSLLCYVADDEP
ncbi:MAG TPA: glycogen debranching enzyme, partial [Thermoguttaceae bacterium]|nr:glycogen debranching enzyme [Thermoguttaceae bacterium]